LVCQRLPDVRTAQRKATDDQEGTAMLRLIYISTARAVVTPAELDGILAVSRRNNALAGVTGLLVVGGRRFLQALEGPEAAVTETFARIGRDPRHFAVVTLRHDIIATRAFPDWSMGYRRGDAIGEAAALPAIVDALTAGIEDPGVRAYFTGFAEVNAAA
jgi:hypothetical protein